tara:strand:- start:783 stop:1184 length:402 start_codon:yes stop_codon:yes gene_type:complete
MTCIEPLTKVTNGADWYDSLTDQDQDLYDVIEERCPEFTKAFAIDCQAFMDALSEHGITTGEQFEDAFFASFDYAHDESHYGEFVEYLVTEVDDRDLPEYLVIDWQASWYRNYRHDFMDIEHDGTVYFFHCHF